MDTRRVKLLLQAGVLALIVASVPIISWTWVTYPQRTADWIVSQVECKDGRLCVNGIPLGTQDNGNSVLRSYGWDNGPPNGLNYYRFFLVPLHIWQKNEAGLIQEVHFTVVDVDESDGQRYETDKWLYFRTEDIHPMYDRMRGRLTETLGVQPQEYAWKDEMTYPRLSSVWQIGPSVVALTVYTGNDSHGLGLDVAEDGRELLLKFTSAPTEESPLPHWDDTAN
jgi:hypothetical protein